MASQVRARDAALASRAHCVAPQATTPAAGSASATPGARKVAGSILASLRALCALSLLASCSQATPAASAIAVSVMYDPALSLTRISYQAFADQADPKSEPALTTFSAQGAALGRPFVVEKREQPVLLLVVQGYGSENPTTPLVEHRVRAAFEQGKTLALHVFLSRSCASKRCDELSGQTCYGEGRNGVLAGTCGPVPGPYSLDAIDSPGQEDDWIPSATETIDARVLSGSIDAGLDAIAALDRDASELDASACALPPGAICNPVARCGCAPGQHCQARSDQLLCAAIPSAGVRERSACAASAECAEGLSCWHGVCRRHCLAASDCGDDYCNLRPTGVGACYQRCGGESDWSCGPGTSCTPLRLPGLVGSFCSVPQTVCEYVEDGECDEPSIGTGVCETGSDGSDCCRAAEGGTCDLIEQCGCARNAGCTVARRQADAAMPEIGCSERGPRGQGETCDPTNTCQRGYGCIGGICKKFCVDDAGCGTGRCIPVAGENSVPVPGANACLERCDYVTGAPCAAGTVCARFPEGDYCFRQEPTCPVSGNGSCEETSRICAPGTDSDCPH